MRKGGSRRRRLRRLGFGVPSGRTASSVGCRRCILYPATLRSAVDDKKTSRRHLLHECRKAQELERTQIVISDETVEILTFAALGSTGRGVDIDLQTILTPCTSRIPSTRRTLDAKLRILLRIDDNPCGFKPHTRGVQMQRSSESEVA